MSIAHRIAGAKAKKGITCASRDATTPPLRGPPVPRPLLERVERDGGGVDRRQRLTHDLEAIPDGRSGCPDSRGLQVPKASIPELLPLSARSKCQGWRLPSVGIASVEKTALAAHGGVVADLDAERHPRSIRRLVRRTSSSLRGSAAEFGLRVSVVEVSEPLAIPVAPWQKFDSESPWSKLDSPPHPCDSVAEVRAPSLRGRSWTALPIPVAPWQKSGLRAFVADVSKPSPSLWLGGRSPGLPVARRQKSGLRVSVAEAGNLPNAVASWRPGARVRATSAMEAPVRWVVRTPPVCSMFRAAAACFGRISAATGGSAAPPGSKRAARAASRTASRRSMRLRRDEGTCGPGPCRPGRLSQPPARRQSSTGRAPSSAPGGRPIPPRSPRARPPSPSAQGRAPCARHARRRCP